MTTWKSKLGTSIDITGLSPQQVSQIQKLANSGYGTKASQVAASARKAGGGKAAGPILPSTPGHTPSGQELAPGTSGQVQSLTGADAASQEWAARQTVGLQNPNISGPEGSQTTTQNPDGSVSVNRTLAAPQQGILDQGEANTLAGEQGAGNLINNYQQFSYDPAQAQEQGFQAAYAKLTENLDNKHNQDTKALDQELHDQGIPYSADPNSQYQQRKNDLERQYNDAKTNAANQAVLTGSNLAQTQYQEGLGTHQAGMTDIGTLQGAGTGFMQPTWDPYQGTAVQMTDPSSIAIGAINAGANQTTAGAMAKYYGSKAAYNTAITGQLNGPFQNTTAPTPNPTGVG